MINQLVCDKPTLRDLRTAKGETGEAVRTVKLWSHAREIINCKAPGVQPLRNIREHK